MRVIVVDGNEACGTALCRRISSLDGLVIQAYCNTLTEAFNRIEQRPPHLVIYSEALAKTPEFETMQTLARFLFVRTLVLGTSPIAPTGRAGPDRLDDPLSDGALHAALMGAMNGRTQRPSQPSAGLFSTGLGVGSDRIILIGSSTGGIDALLNTLGTFPSDCPATVVLQHTGSGFGAGIARLLNARIEPDVKIASPAETLRPGVVVLGSGQGQHLRLSTGPNPTCLYEPGARISGHCPSIDALFHSAVPMAGRVVAAILTGMGRDGAEGLLALRQQGALTICQDRESSVVYGMPRAAVELGAADRVLPLHQIGPALLRGAKRRSAA